MELQHLRYFVAAAECGNVSRAAGRCHVAQPSLSQQIKRLETYLGVTLFDRLGRGVALTDAGRALLPRARKILSEVRDTEANLKRETQDCHGTLMVGAIPTMAPYLLPPALAWLRKEASQCQICVREGLTDDLVEALLDNEIDCALLSTPLQNDFLDVQVLAEEELVVAVAKRGGVKTGAECSIAELRDWPAVTLDEMHCLGRQIQGFCSARNVGSRVVCRTTQLATILEMVAAGMGVSIVPEMTAAADRSGKLRYLHLRPGKPSREIAVAWRKGRTKPKAAEMFVECVKKAISDGVHRRTTTKA